MADNIAKATEYKNLGNTAFTSNKFEEALEHFTKAIELNPADHVFYSNRSGCYASLKQYDKAFQDAEKCVQLKPDWAKGYARKGLAEFYLNNLDDAIKTYETGLGYDPNNAQLKEGLARAQEEASKGGPGGMGGAGGMGGQFMQNMLGKLVGNPKTREYLKDPEFVKKLQMIQTNPQMMSMFMQDPKIMDAFSVMFGGFEGAGEDMPEEHAGAPGGHEHGPGCSHDHGPGGHEGHGHSHGGHEHPHPPAAGHGQKMEEEEKKPEPKKEEPAKPAAPLSEAEQAKVKGNDAYTKRNFAEALTHYNKAIELDPKEIIYYSNKAAVYIEEKKFQEAVNVIDEALKVAEEHGIKDYVKKAKLYARKASALSGLEDFDNAILWFDKSLIEDMNQKVKDEKKKVEKHKKEVEEKNYINPELGDKAREEGNEAFKAGKWPEALKHYEEAIKRNPKDAKSLSNKGSCLIKLMDPNGAKNALEKAVEIDPNFVKAWIKKGSAHHTLKEFHKAMECYERALQLEPENAECKAGIQQTQMAIMYGSAEGDDQRAKRAMQDPEIQSILREPEIVNLLKDLQENPKSQEARKALENPAVSKKLEKLIAAGVLKVG